MQFNRITYHDINIRHSANGGCIVKIGCGEFAFSNPDEMLEAMKQFYNNPQKMEKEYNSVNGPQEVQRTEPDCTEHGRDERPTTRPHTLNAPTRVRAGEGFGDQDVNFDR